MVLSGGELRTFNSKSRFWAIFSFLLNICIGFCEMYRICEMYNRVFGQTETRYTFRVSSRTWCVRRRIECGWWFSVGEKKT